MANSTQRWQQTSRDLEILAVLDLCPLESKDLLALSQTFVQPFGSLDRVRRTLKRLEAAGQVQSWRYAVVGDGGGAAPLYYKLTLDGFRTLHQDDEAVPPTKRYLHEISIARHQHQQFLTKYIVSTHVDAHRHGLRIVDSYPENTYRIETPLGPLFPDRRFTLVTPTGSRFVNCIELDNSTESLVLATSVDSIELKIKKYLHDLAACNYGYRVQFVVTRSDRRREHIRQLVTRLQPNVKFAPFYVVSLEEYLTAANPFLKPIFASSHAKRIGLLRVEAAALLKHDKQPSVSLLPAPALC